MGQKFNNRSLLRLSTSANRMIRSRTRFNNMPTEPRGAAEYYQK